MIFNLNKAQKKNKKKTKAIYFLQWIHEEPKSFLTTFHGNYKSWKVRNRNQRLNIFNE